MDIQTAQSLFTVNFHLLKSCNLKCKFCYAHFRQIAKENLLPVEKAYTLLRQLKDAGCMKMNFAGGEPFLHPHIGELIKYSYNLGLKTSIITNSTLLYGRMVGFAMVYIYTGSL